MALRAVPRVGVALSIFPRLPSGVIDITKVLLIQRGTEPGKGMWVYPGGKQEFGETIAEAALREGKEELSFSSDCPALAVVDPICPAFTCTDVLHPHGADLASLTFHYAILHVLTFLDVPASLISEACLPPVTAQSDAADAAWIDQTW